MYSTHSSELEEAYTNLKAVLGLSAESPIPKIPRPNNDGKTPATDSTLIAPPHQGKRKAPDQDGDISMVGPAEDTSSKRSKMPAQVTGGSNQAPPIADNISEPQMEHARAAASFITFLTPESLLPPKLPTREEMEEVLLNLRKQTLVEEYFGNGEDENA